MSTSTHGGADDRLKACDVQEHPTKVRLVITQAIHTCTRPQLFAPFPYGLALARLLGEFFKRISLEYKAKYHFMV
jgi:hypothetical protein